MNKKKLSSILCLATVIVLLQSCAVQKNKILWVSGIKTNCSSGAGKVDCFKVHKGKSLDNPNWENFYTNIEGFQFEEGFLKKVEVKEEKIANPPADGSSIKYTMVKELEKKVDGRAQVGGEWTLNKMRGKPIDGSIKKLPTMKIDLAQMMLAGLSGCNNYRAQINDLTISTINLGPAMSSLMGCQYKHIENDYLKALKTINTYQISDDTLMFFNESNDEVLSYVRGIKTNESERNSVQNLQGNWSAVMISGNPIETDIPAPKMEINLAEMKVSGTDGCNNYFGVLKEVTDFQIVFGVLASSKKLCSKMGNANAFNKVIDQVASYKADELTLVLMNKEGDEILVFQKSEG